MMKFFKGQGPDEGLGLSITRAIKFLLPFVVATAIAVVAVALRWSTIDSRWAFVTGAPARTTYYALADMTYEDHNATEQLRKAVSAGIMGVMVKSRTTARAFQDEYQVLLNAPLEDSSLPLELRELLEKLRLDEREELLSVVRSIRDDLKRGQMLTPEKKDEMIWQRIELLEPDPATANLAFQLLLALTENENVVSQEMTGRLKKLAQADVVPVQRRIFAGETLVEEGEVVTPEIAGRLRAQGYPEGQLPLGALGLALLSALLVTLWVYQVGREERPREGGRQMVWQGGWSFLLSLMALGWLMDVLCLRFLVEGLGTMAIVAILYLTQPERVALHLALALTIGGAAVTSGTSLTTFVIGVLAGTTAPLAGLAIFRGRYSRFVLFTKIFSLGVILSTVTLLLNWGLTRTISIQSVLLSLLAVLIISVLTVAALPVMEALFDVLSPLRLMELTHPSHPLLRRLQIEAPGTYHHVQMVGNLAEAAAERLGLNPLLLRAGACFHDIGKLRRPQYFIENQFSGVNPHDNLTPTMSAMIILSHVPDGLELAEEYRLPMRLRDFIPEHHGTTCLSYFYHKALKDGQVSQEDQFCYPGPKPQSRETALLMLADSIEASARAGGQQIRRVSDITKIIDGVVESKMAARQLDEAGFTMRDIAEAKAAMFETLRSMYHTRDIKPLNEGKKQKKTDDAEPQEEARP